MRNLVLVFLALIVGCSKAPDKYQDRPLKDIYVSARDKMSKSDFESAAEEFLEVDRQYPYSSWASKSVLMSAFCYYKGKKFDESIRNLEIFTRFNTTSPSVDYAYYLKGVCYLAQVNSSQKDMERAEDALNAFRTLLRKFPTSKYVQDSRLKLIYLNNLIAAHEMFVGRFYQAQKNFIAAIKHFKFVIEFYFNTPQMPEAYYRCVESLIALNLYDEAKAQFAEMPSIDMVWYNRAKALLDKFSGYPRYKLKKIK